MKKLLSLTLALMLVLSIISSCVSFRPLDSSTNTLSETQTNTQTSAETNTSNTPQASVISWQFNYDYGFHRENIVTLLVASSKLMTGFENVTIPDDIVAGDIINIEYTGKILTELSYPGSTSLYNGEVKSYSFTYANVIHLEGEELALQMPNIKLIYDFSDSYVILDRSGKYVSLDEYEGDELYLVTDQEKYEKIKEQIEDDVSGKYPVACMLAYNPRDLEDGNIIESPEPSDITEPEAIEIASAHFNNELDIYNPPEYFVYKARIIDGNDTAFHYVFFDLEYIGDPELIPDLFNYFTYTYKISKESGEIVDISSDW